MFTGRHEHQCRYTYCRVKLYRVRSVTDTARRGAA
jgi:hypothetical protein